MPRLIFWAAVWLAVALTGVKASHLPVPRSGRGLDYLNSLTAITFRDIVFVLCFWALARGLLLLARSNPRMEKAIARACVAIAALTLAYAVASIIAFLPLGGFPTYALLQLVGSVRMMSSSITAFITPFVGASLLLVPVAYVAAVVLSARYAPMRAGVRRGGVACVWIVSAIWIGNGYYVFATDWKTHWNWRVAENAPWVLASSAWKTMSAPPARLLPTFGLTDLTDFSPIGSQPAPRPQARRRPPNVIVVVLESVAARWTGISGGAYETTPSLKAAAAQGATFDRFYAHIGRSSNSLASILLSIYTKLDFVDYTQEYTVKERQSLASVLADRGYRTAFMTSSNMAWADWDDFVPTHGFDEVHDDRSLPCATRVTSWGVADECLVDGMRAFVDGNRREPFFLMAWTQQTHHPYEPAPGAPELALVREPNIPDAYNLGRYLNVLHETDRQLGRLFDTLRAHGLADDTMVVITGDHGQAFGFPHNSYLQGRNVYDEDVRVPLLISYPRVLKKGTTSNTVGGLVDLAPTIADLAGVAPAPDWQGRSLFTTKRPPRAYFYVAQDEFRLGVREGAWKYILDLRSGLEELYDLEHDPIEWENLARHQPERSARMRQHLAAWLEANQRQYSAE